MTITRQTEAKITVGGITTIEKIDYYEVGIQETDKMLEEVKRGGNIEKLREKMIKNSKR